MVAELTRTRALIVGGTAGIGLACARRLLADGAPAVAISGRNRDRGEAAAAALRESFRAEILYLQCDASDPAAVEAMVAECERAIGGPDFLLSCGGGDPTPRLLKDIPLAEIIPTMNALQAPILHPARAVLEGMAARGGGAIVCVASDAGKVATPGETPIGAAMASIIMFCRAMANEVKRHKIRVNCLTPSIVQGTPLFERLMQDEFTAKIFGKAAKLAELGVAETGDLAALVSLLAGPHGVRITGQAISVNGGISVA